MNETSIDLRWWAKFIKEGVEDCEYMECQHGDKVCSDCNYWSTLIYSSVTGWQQILWFNDSPQKNHAIVSITYYPTALAALMDHSIFPAGSMVAFGNYYLWGSENENS
jgi:hypothetical protein